MTDFKLFRHKSNGVVASYPEDWIDHPQFGYDLEFYDPEGYEEDKVVVEGHELPVEQRGQVIAKPLDDFTVPELQDIARGHGLETGGKKDELIARINDYNAKDGE